MDKTNFKDTFSDVTMLDKMAEFLGEIIFVQDILQDFLTRIESLESLEKRLAKLEKVVEENESRYDTVKIRAREI